MNSENARWARMSQTFANKVEHSSLSDNERLSRNARQGIVEHSSLGETRP
jgi:hypothetical protein